MLNEVNIYLNNKSKGLNMLLPNKPHPIFIDKLFKSLEHLSELDITWYIMSDGKEVRLIIDADN